MYNDRQGDDLLRAIRHRLMIPLDHTTVQVTSVVELTRTVTFDEYRVTFADGSTFRHPMN